MTAPSRWLSSARATPPLTTAQRSFFSDGTGSSFQFPDTGLPSRQSAARKPRHPPPVIRQVWNAPPRELLGELALLPGGTYQPAFRQKFAPELSPTRTRRRQTEELSLPASVLNDRSRVSGWFQMAVTCVPEPAPSQNGMPSHPICQSADGLRWWQHLHLLIVTEDAVAQIVRRDDSCHCSPLTHYIELGRDRRDLICNGCCRLRHATHQGN
jgi:hypothetical protein